MIKLVLWGTYKISKNGWKLNKKYLKTRFKIPLSLKISEKTSKT